MPLRGAPRAATDAGHLRVRSPRQCPGAGRQVEEQRAGDLRMRTDAVANSAPGVDRIRPHVPARWPTVTAGQNLQVAQAGCYYAVSTASIGVPAAGGTGRFDVLQMSEPNTCGGATQDRCRWTAQSDVPWLTIATTMPQAGDNPVSFSVSANPTTTARTGRITVRDKVVHITQSGQ